MKKAFLFLCALLLTVSCGDDDDKRFNPETDWVEITVNHQLSINDELTKLADKYLKAKTVADDDCSDGFQCTTPNDGTYDKFFRNVIIKGDIAILKVTASALFEGIYNLDMSQTKVEELFYSVMPANAKWVALPETLKDMNAAFAGCNMLEEMTIPSNTETIHDYNFEKLSSLKRVVVNAPIPPDIKYAGENGNEELYPKIYPASTWKLIVPKGAKNAYEEHEWWSRFSSIEEK